MNSTPEPISPLSPFRAVVLDDHATDREWLRTLLRRHPSIHLRAEASTFSQAMEQLVSEKADVLFLESEIGGASVIPECTLIPPTVKLIFITRRPEAAVEAFELEAVDFLLKPLAAPRLSETVRRLLRIEWRRGGAPVEVKKEGSLLIPFERGRRGVSLQEIVLIQAFGNYTRVTLTHGESEIVLRSLAKWEQLLPTPPFLRVHRNTLVHSQKVMGLHDESDGTHRLQLEGVEEQIAVSRRCLPEVRQVLFGH